MSKLNNVPAVEGAAEYFAVDNEVVMRAEGYVSTIDVRSSHEQAIKAAKTWQRKENRAVLKSKGII